MVKILFLNNFNMFFVHNYFYGENFLEIILITWILKKITKVFKVYLQLQGKVSN